FVGDPSNRYQEVNSSGQLVPVEPRLTAYYYTTAMVKDLTGMVFSHVIKSDELEVDDMIVNPSNDLYAIAFKPAPGVSKPNCIALWYGTRSGKEGLEMVRVDNVTSVVTSVYRGIEELKQESSITEVLTTLAEPEHGRVVNIEIS